MRLQRGFTLLEMSIAFTVLVTGMLGTWGMLARGQQAGQRLWEETIAHELAASALERAMLEENFQPTEPEGRGISMETSARSLLPPEIKVVLHVSPVSGSERLFEFRAVASWLPTAGRFNGLRAQVQRRMRLRKP